MNDTLENLKFINDGEGIGGDIKQRYDDFIVEEVPLYPLCGSGGHCFCFIEKVGISTQYAVKILAEKLNIEQKRFGFSGLKDTDAIARQWISVEGVSAESLSELQLKNIKILQTGLHGNKLKIGHLSANKFKIKIRNIEKDFHIAAKKAEQILDILKSKGVPNYFGIQRFGRTGSNHLMGMAILLDDADGFLDLFLGGSKTEIAGKIKKARKFYENGLLQRALNNWPPSNPDERKALRTLIKTGNARKAVWAVSKYLRGFYTNAFQSYIFNKAVSERIAIIDTVLQGDIAYRHSDEKCFQVQDCQTQQQRCSNFEISATAPMIGYRMTELKYQAGELEEKFLRNEGFDYGSKVFTGKLLTGSRRPIRFEPKDCAVESGKDVFGEFLEISFTLPPGCYATSLLREIMKSK